MTSRPTRSATPPPRQQVLLTIGAGVMATAYILGKVEYALAGRLGIHGGPTVAPESLARYRDAGEIANAQWANAAVGLAMLLLTAVPLLPVVHRWHRWVVAGPLVLAGLALIAFGCAMIVRGALTGVGGYPFGAFSMLWGALLVVLARTHRGRAANPRQGQGPGCGVSGNSRSDRENSPRMSKEWTAFDK